MSRTVAPAPTDPGMWKRLAKKRAHPDGDGDHDLFIWVQSVRGALSEPTECRSCITASKAALWRGVNRYGRV